MPNCLKNYRDKEKCRAYRNRNRKRYYQKHNYSNGKRVHWTYREIEMVVKHEMPDVEIAKKLHRSVQAVQVMRNKQKQVTKNETSTV